MKIRIFSSIFWLSVFCVCLLTFQAHYSKSILHRMTPVARLRALLLPKLYSVSAGTAPQSVAQVQEHFSAGRAQSCQWSSTTSHSTTTSLWRGSSHDTTRNGASHDDPTWNGTSPFRFPPSHSCSYIVVLLMDTLFCYWTASLSSSSWSVVSNCGPTFTVLLHSLFALY